MQQGLRLCGTRFTKFAAVGLSGVVVNLGFLHVLVERVGLPDLASAAIAIELSIVSNFVLNNALTFRDRNARAGAGVAARLLRYHLVALVGVAIQLATFYLLNRAHAHATGAAEPGAFRYASQSAGIVIATSWTFFSNLTFTWRQRAPQTGGAHGT